MTEQEVLLITWLIENWADDLEKEVEKLESSLPIEREITIAKEYIGDNFLGPVLFNPQTNPEKFKDVEVKLPLTELNHLREIATTMRRWIDRMGVVKE